MLRFLNVDSRLQHYQPKLAAHAGEVLSLDRLIRHRAPIDQVSRASGSRAPCSPCSSRWSAWWLDLEWRQPENSRRAKFHWVARSGRKQLEVEMGNWNRRASAIARLLKVEG